MLTPKQNYLELLNGGKPERFVNQYEPFKLIMGDPLMWLARNTRVRGQDVKDLWGVTIRWKAEDYAAIPYITEETKVCKDITEWKKYVHAPSLLVDEERWAKARKRVEEVDKDSYMPTVLMATGLFEQLHYLMGFEDTLMNFLLEPEAMHELLDYILDYKMQYVDILTTNLKPDAILFHDDWGAKDRLFMSRDTWVEFFKERYRKLFDFARSRGVHVVLHADSWCENIAEDMAEIGISTWQGTLPSNNIPKLQKELGGKMLLMGGIDAGKLDFENWDREEVNKEVARVCAEYGPGGGFIPCITYGLAESIYPGLYEAISEEIEKQSKIYFG